jgi:hypothetical protein
MSCRVARAENAGRNAWRKLAQPALTLLIAIYPIFLGRMAFYVGRRSIFTSQPGMRATE